MGGVWMVENREHIGLLGPTGHRFIGQFMGDLNRGREVKHPAHGAGASGKGKYDHRVGFPPRPQGGASSRLARENPPFSNTFQHNH